MTALVLALWKHAAILFGALLGAAAHFGLLIYRRVPVTVSMVAGYFLMLGMACLIAVYLTEMAGVVGSEQRAFFSAIIAYSANDVIRFIADRQWPRLLEVALGVRGLTTDTPPPVQAPPPKTEPMHGPDPVKDTSGDDDASRGRP